MRWTPFVTVAAVIEQNNRFLLVEELIKKRKMLNQPAGHWEPGETLVDAVIRETLEETGWDFVPQNLLGTYCWVHPESQATYLRFAFTGRLLEHHPEQTLDDGILQTLWLDADEIKANRSRHRSPQLLRCIEDYMAGKQYPLDCLVNVD